MGRFQKTDEFGYYETLYRENGVEAIFVGHGDLKDDREDDNDDSYGEELLKDVGKPLERALAKKHSRDLSRKVFAGARKVSEQGNRAGGPAPYGTVRIEVNEHRELVGIMKPKQHKSYPNHRVRLAPDKEGAKKGKSGIVCDIFGLFTTGNCSEAQIAGILNERNVPAPMGGKWQTESIRRVLQNEQ